MFLILLTAACGVQADISDATALLQRSPVRGQADIVFDHKLDQIASLQDTVKDALLARMTSPTGWASLADKFKTLPKSSKLELLQMAAGLPELGSIVSQDELALLQSTALENSIGEKSSSGNNVEGSVSDKNGSPTTTTTTTTTDGPFCKCYTAGSGAPVNHRACFSSRKSGASADTCLNYTLTSSDHGGMSNFGCEVADKWWRGNDSDLFCKILEPNFASMTARKEHLESVAPGHWLAESDNYIIVQYYLCVDKKAADPTKCLSWDRIDAWNEDTLSPRQVNITALGCDKYAETLEAPAESWTDHGQGQFSSSSGNSCRPGR